MMVRDTQQGDLGPARHIPVLVRSVLEYLAPHDGGIYIDGTFGAGGHAGAILAAADARVIGIDRDPAAIADGQSLVAAAGRRLVLVEGEFAALDGIATEHAVEKADGVVLDLGVSSMQLDTPARGFSFRHDGPLDMRMGGGRGGGGPSAAEVVAAASERDLADIIFLLGEERHSRAVARAIAAARRQHPIDTTRALADIVGRAVPARPGGIHPATRTFQALRLFVNEELRQLADGLAAAERILKPGGRLVVISFHSLEDRIVKTFLAQGGRDRGSRHLPETTRPPATFTVLTPRPVTPDEAEISDNPRARSAKLRAAVRTDAEPRAARPAPTLPSPALRGGRGPRLPSLADVLRGA
jgi:16S rRNA (cytosine1402-N4)-methyltransferase